MGTRDYGIIVDTSLCMHRSPNSIGNRTKFTPQVGGRRKNVPLQRRYEYLNRTQKPQKYWTENNGRCVRNYSSAISSGPHHIVATISSRGKWYDKRLSMREGPSRDILRIVWENRGIASTGSRDFQNLSTRVVVLY